MEQWQRKQKTMSWAETAAFLNKALDAETKRRVAAEKLLEEKYAEELRQKGVLAQTE